MSNEFHAARSRYVQKKDPEQPDELGDLAMVNFLAGEFSGVGTFEQ